MHGLVERGVAGVVFAFECNWRHGAVRRGILNSGRIWGYSSNDKIERGTEGSHNLQKKLRAHTYFDPRYKTKLLAYLMLAPVDITYRDLGSPAHTTFAPSKTSLSYCRLHDQSDIPLIIYTLPCPDDRIRRIMINRSPPLPNSSQYSELTICHLK